MCCLHASVAFEHLENLLKSYCSFPRKGPPLDIVVEHNWSWSFQEAAQVSAASDAKSKLVTAD